MSFLADWASFSAVVRWGSWGVSPPPWTDATNGAMFNHASDHKETCWFIENPPPTNKDPELNVAIFLEESSLSTAYRIYINWKNCVFTRFFLQTQNGIVKPKDHSKKINHRTSVDLLPEENTICYFHQTTANRQKPSTILLGPSKILPALRFFSGPLLQRPSELQLGLHIMYLAIDWFQGNL